MARRELERRKFRKLLETSFGSAYIISGVTLKRAVVDLNSALISINGSTLKVACPPPGIGQNFEIVLLAESAWLDIKRSANES